MMQRLCTKLRSLPALHSANKTTTAAAGQQLSLLSLPSHRLLHTSSPILHSGEFQSNAPLASYHRQSLLSPHPLSVIQVRHLTKKEMKEKMKKYKPSTPVISKLKKYKIKCYSSYKGRFRVMKDGQIRRWKEGKRHNAHLKSKKAKRRGRQPGLVPPAYAKVMKKLNFCG